MIVWQLIYRFGTSGKAGSKEIKSVCTLPSGYRGEKKVIALLVSFQFQNLFFSKYLAKTIVVHDHSKKKICRAFYITH